MAFIVQRPYTTGTVAQALDASDLPNLAILPRDVSEALDNSGDGPSLRLARWGGKILYAFNVETSPASCPSVGR